MFGVEAAVVELWWGAYVNYFLCWVLGGERLVVLGEVSAKGLLWRK
jgi:hypothetical protein